MTSEQQSRDAALMAFPSRDWLVTAVQEEQGSRRRAAWPKTLRSDAEPATVEGVTHGYLDAARRYADVNGYLAVARREGRITRAEATALTIDSDSDAARAAWLSILPKLPPPVQNRVIQAPAKQQLFWHMLPLAVGLRDNRAPDVSLRRSAMPQWHRPPADPDEARELGWFFPVEGFTTAPTIAALHADSLFATVPTGADLPGWRIVDTEAQLYDGVMAGYVDPVLDRYISELSKSGARFSRRGLRASGIGPLVQQPARDFQAAVRILRETAERDGADSRAFRERAEWAAELGAGATRRATVALVNLATGPEDRRLFNFIPVQARIAPEVKGIFVTRRCCGAFGGDRGNTCNNCVMDFPRGVPNPVAQKRLDSLGLELTPTPRGGAPDSSRRSH